jgi:hypothetical protein
MEKVRNIVGLYLNPPDHALVLCVDESRMLQACRKEWRMLATGLARLLPATQCAFAQIASEALAKSSMPKCADSDSGGRGKFAADC